MSNLGFACVSIFSHCFLIISLICKGCCCWRYYAIGMQLGIINFQLTLRLKWWNPGGRIWWTIRCFTSVEELDFWFVHSSLWTLLYLSRNQLLLETEMTHCVLRSLMNGLKLYLTKILSLSFEVTWKKFFQVSFLQFQDIFAFARIRLIGYWDIIV